MKKQVFFFLAVSLVGSLACKTHNNPVESKDGPRTEYGNKTCNEQMAGNEPNYLNHSISGISTKSLAKQLLGNIAQKYDYLQLVRYPLIENRYLLIAKTNNYTNPCREDKQLPSMLIMFEWKNKHGTIIDELKNTKYEELCGDNLEILYTPISLGPKKQGFSILSTTTVGYSGGGANVSLLHLFEVDEKKMVLKASTLYAGYSDIAGEWNKDGTRQHDIEEISCTLFADKKSVIQGYYNFKKKCKGTKGNTFDLLKYDLKSKMYLNRKKIKEVTEIDKM